MVERTCTEADIDEAVETPPQTTRARLRGEFIRRAKERKRDYTVDWVHLKLNDQAQRTVLCKDPFRSRDERVEKLIASLVGADVPHGDGHRAARGAARACSASRPTSGGPTRSRSSSGTVAVGDRVVLNTTAVELGLGTGGWHVVHWNPARDGARGPGPGPHHEAPLHEPPGRRRLHRGARRRRPTTDLDGMPVVVGQPAQPGAGRGGGASSDAHPTRAPRLRDDRRRRAADRHLRPRRTPSPSAGLIDATITAGHAFGGDLEAVSVPSALALARHVAARRRRHRRDGPGRRRHRRRRSAPPRSRWPAILDAAAALGGTPIAVLRMSDGDPRPRHQGVSHHSRTALDLTRSSVLVAVARATGAFEHDRHDVARRRRARRRRAPRRARPARHDDGPRSRRGPAVLPRRPRAAGALAAEHL